MNQFLDKQPAQPEDGSGLALSGGGYRAVGDTPLRRGTARPSRREPADETWRQNWHTDEFSIRGRLLNIKRRCRPHFDVCSFIV
jgi:hypothetical protein